MYFVKLKFSGLYKSLDPIQTGKDDEDRKTDTLCSDSIRTPALVTEMKQFAWLLEVAG